MVGSAAVDLLALTGNEIALAAVAGAFILFALIVSMVVPRYRPDFPGRGGVGVLVLASIVFFLGTMTAVFVLEDKEEEVAHVETSETETTADQTVESGTEGEAETGEEEVGPEIAETEGSETEPAAPATTAPGESVETVRVTATDFDLEVKETKFAPSRYTFELRNDGDTPHNLVIEGPDVDRAETPVIAAGARATVDVTLEPGTYKLYCSVPGHEDLGMVEEVTVG
jgi:plastocyanin